MISTGYFYPSPAGIKRSRPFVPFPTLLLFLFINSSTRPKTLEEYPRYHNLYGSPKLSQQPWSLSVVVLSRPDWDLSGPR
ncbi:hypothetical protein FVER53590_29900 [Fusarium verticillioides]|nr:hypothetical protein FVER53263_20814 [Fusarium verticillioides]RBR13953.1 hypothetical protein FVER53590_29900 [Fusarium verticillioides]